ncbi:MAG: DNA polymerase III subunit delta [Candidatus Falkowbacteria bacterium]|nr:DNA polymerase III subunit delta [Candidatus Falkowbacteria bacterium]
MIIFIYGPDTFRSQRKIKELKEKFINEVDPRASSLNVLSGASANLKNIQEAIATGSLFVKKRLVVIENLFVNKTTTLFPELLNYLKKTSATTKDDEATIIIFYDEELNTKDKPIPAAAKPLFTWLSQQKYVQEFKALSNDQLVKFIKDEFKQYDKTINPAALQALLTLVGPDLWRLHQEINKLANYQLGEAEIKLAQVKELVTNTYEENIFALTDALSAKNKKLATALLEEQYLAGASEEYILSMLMRQFKIILQIKDADLSKMDPERTSQELKLHPYVVKKAWGAAKNFSSQELKNYLNKLIEIDYLNKSGRGDLKTEISLLISAI